MRALLNTIYPAQCLMCDDFAQDHHALCPSCWREVTFIEGCLCHKCGVQLPQDDGASEYSQKLTCDSCLDRKPSWSDGRAALMYDGYGRRLVQGLRHHDRTEYAKPAAQWLLKAAAPLLERDTLLIPTPTGWTSLFIRKYHPPALLCRALSKLTKNRSAPSALRLKGREKELSNAAYHDKVIALKKRIFIPKYQQKSIQGQNILLIDDLMWDGASQEASTQILYEHGAKKVSCLSLVKAGFVS